MMAETILYKVAAEILKSLGSLAAQQVGSIYGLANELHKLSTTVSSLQAVLIDAQEQQGTSHEDWIMRLKKVFFEADDLLDDFATEVTHRKLVDKVGIFFSKSNPMLYNLKISHRLKAIRQNLDLIAKDKASLNLVERRQPLHFEPNSVQLNLDRETYSFVPDGEVIGRNDDKKEIVDFLLDSEAEENVVVISIIGLGGLGKTTLAQWVYNDEMVKENFDKRLWVCVSDVFEVKMIAEKIVESAGGERANYLQLDAVQKELKEMLDGKKYLLNIDGLEGDDDKLMLPSNTPTDERYFSSLKQLELEKISEKLLKQILCPPHHLSPLCNLNDLTLVSVDRLVTMPEDVFKSLTSLQSLSIRSCRTLVSLSTCLTHLTSLEFLCIEACPLLDLSNEEAMQFQTPGNLTTFRVLRLDKLMTLPVWLQHFSGTLKSIAIWDCHNFTTIPEWIGDLISLNCLKIDGSPMLTSLPEGMRSLAALQMLIVERGSSILKQRCQKEVGEDWPKIAHIPGVYIRE